MLLYNKYIAICQELCIVNRYYILAHNNIPWEKHLSSYKLIVLYAECEILQYLGKLSKSLCSAFTYKKTKKKSRIPNYRECRFHVGKNQMKLEIFTCSTSKFPCIASSITLVLETDPNNGACDGRFFHPEHNLSSGENDIDMSSLALLLIALAELGNEDVQ